ncbi:hypothetical protein PC9H_007846 [Pleurotus ostreatus]|uniref:C2H2-type domain-containing protein n=1 Tax=Pleurotus ostreatus TaxID=5322 RepID=A0A8H6ZU86_PLEOS|nr:uncharacterized protein PC9H_007846 [Pleurotus ostreatus]KAF7428619.1 hypothetical protein PC9H_007846 [Pleurotus ostreatus]KAJ8696795.1 hypothetical protein PTI98_006633 [Pleurotus ostreatus]
MSESPSSQQRSALSLLSLSVAAASAAPIPVPQDQQASSGDDSLSTSVGRGGSLGVSNGGTTKQHRRLASTGKARRRLSDARDAAARPSSLTALSLASLSLSTSTDTALASPLEDSYPVAVIGDRQHDSDTALSTSVPDNLNSALATPITIGKNGKKRGMDYKCESCSKIYRHPSCLIKHRWEHTPQWREASKFVLSKHQQVQLLEAAAILSHMSPGATGTSLPDDRSLWPAFLSGSPVAQPPPPENAPGATSTHEPTRPISSSVPAASALGSITRAGSTGPRLHDYSIPASAAVSGSITQVRPGLVGVSTTTNAQTRPVPVPNNNSAFTTYRTVSASADSWGSPYSPVAIGHGIHGPSQSGIRSTSGSASHSYYTRSADGGGGGWSLPRSSLRSISRSSPSQRSRSDSASMDEDESVEVDVDGLGFAGRGRRNWKGEDDEFSIGFSVKEEDEEKKQDTWDGMEMEMDMD